jgi:subtilisin family serine protease
MKTTVEQAISRSGAALLLFALAVSATTVLAGPCEPDLDEDQLPADVVITLDRSVLDQPAAIADLLNRYAAIEAFDPPRNIHPLRAWLVRTALLDEARDGLLDDLRNEPTVKHADEHWRFQTPEGVQRAFPDLTRAPTIDDFLVQPAATVIRALPSGRRWTGAGVTVALIDTAASFDNPVTSGSIAGAGFDLIDGEPSADVPPNGTDDDGDGDIDESRDHGTFAAGLVHLAAPGARLLHVRALDDDGHGDAWDVAQGIVQAAEAGADVINLSLGLTNEQDILEEAMEWAVQERGIVVVAAAGNRASPCVDRPASQVEDGVIAVAAVDDQLLKTDFTNWGEEIALSAPGLDLISTVGTELGHWSGTSFATPLVAGGAAVLLEKYPDMTPEDVKNELMQTAQPFPMPEPEGMGSGVLDLGGIQDFEGPYRGSLTLVSDGNEVFVAWNPVLGATRYDLVRGEIGNLRRDGAGTALGPLTCIRENIADAPVAEVLGDTERPVPGGFFYLLRDDGVAQPGDPADSSLGFSSDGRPRVAASIDCAP